MKLKLLTCMGIFILSLAGPAHAEQKPWRFGWWPGHWEWTSYKKFHPYLENGKQTQNQQWAAEDWYVQDWLSQHENEFALIDGFFRVDVLRKQTSQDGVPVVVVGPQFYHLGGLDKRRVMTTLDEVYGITASGEHPVILLQDWHTRREIGIFTKDGLQIE